MEVLMNEYRNNGCSRSLLGNIQFRSQSRQLDVS